MKIIGHRGARGLAPENTIASLKKALEHNVDEVECDLRVTKDDVVILHHDPYITHPNGGRINISTNTFANLRHHKPNLATLSQWLANSNSTALYLEVKPKVKTAPIIAELKKTKPANVSIGSKSQKTLLEIHQALPDIEKIVIHPWSGIIATHRARQLNTKRVSMNKICLWHGYIKAVSRHGYKLSTYTLNDPKKAKKWEKAGLYGVVTDYPDLFEK